MHMRQAVAGILAVLLCICPSYASDKAKGAPDKAPPPLSVSAKYYEAFDMNTGQELLGKRENEKMYPASITKVLFSEVLLDHLGENGIKTSAEAGEVISKDNEMAASAGLYRSGLKAGEKVTWDDLLHSIIYMSGAEACYAAVRIAFGTEQKAAEEMNRKASQLGLKSSHFVNVTGNHSTSHYTTCSDFVKVMKAAWENSTLSSIFSSEQYTTSDGRHTFVSPTVRASQNGGADLIGGKTGTTDAAQHTFAGFAKSEDHTIIIIVGLCPLSVPGSNIRDAGAIARYIDDEYVPQKIPETLISDGVTYTPQTKGQVLLPKGPCHTFVRDGAIVLKSNGQEAVIQAAATQNVPGTEAPAKKESKKESKKKTAKKSKKEKGGIVEIIIGIIKRLRKLIGPMPTSVMRILFGN